MTQWIHKWKRNNWKTVSKENVKNKDSLLELDKVISLMKCVDWVRTQIFMLVFRWKMTVFILILFINKNVFLETCGRT